MKLLPPLCSAGVILVLLSLAACGGSARTDNEAYPIVDPSAPGPRVEVTAPDGTVHSLPAPPTTHESNPSPSCERVLATFHDGSKPTQRLIVIPPMPGVRAVAVTKHTTRVEWWFRDLPADCKPVAVVVAVRKGLDPRVTPSTKQVGVHGASGSTEITYAEFLPPPDVAWATAYLRSGAASRSTSVLIERPTNVPPNPPPAPPPVTAPAGQPIECTSAPTIVDDPAGDILTHDIGSRPAPIARMTPELSAIDITRAAVQIDGRTICATFTFAGPPAHGIFQVTITLRDASSSSCCASLRFRRTAGLEVGYDARTAKGDELQPVRDAGAAIHGNTLVMTGTLPPPSTWPYLSHRIPSTKDIGWSATTDYYPKRYGPGYFDSLPRHEAVTSR